MATHADLARWSSTSSTSRAIDVVAGGSLPFTGANLAMYAGAGVAMAAAGIGLRTLAGRDSASAQR